ncbi:hypothetical protein RB199_11745 [Streptomyces libani]
MTAGVHHAGVLRRPGHTGLLVHRQGVEFTADGDGRTAAADADHGAGAGDLGSGVPAGQRGEHQLAGRGLVARQTGPGVELMAQLDGVVQLPFELCGEGGQGVVEAHAPPSRP